MKYLKEYVEEFNKAEQLFCSKPRVVTFPMTPKMKKFIKERIECDLSPENLCCDGEASQAYVHSRSRLLHGALAELEAL